MTTLFLNALYHLAYGLGHIFMDLGSWTSRTLSDRLADGKVEPRFDRLTRDTIHGKDETW